MDAKVITRLILPDDLGHVVLYDWTAAPEKNCGNLARLDNEGREIWRTTPPEEVRTVNDCFVTVQWDGNSLTANTFSCFLVSVDVSSGSVTPLRFTK